MTRVVADASVVVKWLLPDDEADLPQALRLLDDVRTGRVRLVQPPHWLAEVAAVLARLSPETAADDVADLATITCEVVRTVSMYRRAVDLAVRLDHHLFDTLYHAVALETPGARFVTADDRYYRKAHAQGRIHRLAGEAA